MHLAAMYGQAAIIQQLAAAGANVNPQDFLGRTPLCLAVSQCHVSSVTALLASGATPDIGALESWSLLPPAAAGGLLELLRSLLSGVAAGDVHNDDKRLACQLAGSQEGLVMLEGLLVVGAALPAKERHELTLLHLASLAGTSGVIGVLICAGTDVDVQIQVVQVKSLSLVEYQYSSTNGCCHQRLFFQNCGTLAVGNLQAALMSGSASYMHTWMLQR